MGNSFVEAFSSTIDINTASDLFAKEKPTYSDLHDLINKLSEQQALKNLDILLTILNEKGDILENNTVLKARITNLLLLNALKDSDKKKIKQRLDALETLLTHNHDLWQDILSSLIQWIANHNQAEELLCLLQCLPPTQRERLYERLLETVDGSPHWLNTLINFVLTHRIIDSFDEELYRHLRKLIPSLLLSPTVCSIDSINQLTIMLTTEQLVDITFQLRAIAATYAPENREKQHPRFVERRQLYLSKYETLVTALTVRATTSQSEYQRLIQGNRELANLLMAKRLKTQTTLSRQKELILELLENCKAYDWQEPLFKMTAMDSLLTVLANLSANESGSYFKQYYNYRSGSNLSEVIRLLDALFKRTNDKEKILYCIRACDDEDKTFSINFITGSTARNNSLTEACLQRLQEEQLINLCGHIIALRHIIHHENEPLSTVYYHVLCKKISLSTSSDTYFAHLAQAIKLLLPENIQSDSISTIFAHFNDSSTLRYQWLNALFKAQFNKTLLLPHCQDLLKLLRLPEQIMLLKNFTSEELLALYLSMTRHNAMEGDFNCFVELLKETDRQPLLLYLLLNSPMINQLFLDKLIPFIDDRNLITLIEQMLEKVQSDSDYNATLEQLLIYFCQRLQMTNDDTAPIHQWIDCQQANTLAKYLLENPPCFYALSIRSSLLQNITPYLLHGYVVNRVEDDLRLRANRVLNIASLDFAMAENIALNLLGHFHLQPKKLQSLFTNLEAMRNSLSERSRRNYNYLKQACWQLLKPKTERYDEKLCVALLTAQLTSSHCFDPILAKLASNLCNNNDAHLSAQYLAQIEDNSLEQIDVDSLAMILTKSMQDASKDNWQKVAAHFKDKSAEQTLIFVQSLIAQIKCCNNNPLLIEQGLKFIINLANFEELLPVLEDEQLQWLVRESKPADLLEKFPQWLDILLAKQKFDKLDCGALFALLPPQPIFLERLYQCEALKPYLNKLFIQLTQHDNCTTHFIVLFQQLNKQSNEIKHQFINDAQRTIQPQNVATMVLPIINMVLLTLSDLQAGNYDDAKLVLDHMQLFAILANHQMKDPIQHSHVMRELQQLVMNTLGLLKAQDIRWANLLLKSEGFAQFALTWLKEIESKEIGRHPFTQILLENCTIRMHPALTSDARYQEFIKQLLRVPPAAMKDDQFAILFDTLSKQNQKELALDLLQRPTLGDVQWSSLMTLARVLPVETLYDIYERSKTRFVFVDLLVRHPVGIEKLTNLQKNRLMRNINSGKQVLRILDSYSPKSAKNAFVAAIFDYLEESKIPLSTWLETMNVDTQTFAAFTNYTTRKEDKYQLKQLIDENTYRSSEIRDYLQNPTLDMPMEQNGLLYLIIEQTALKPWQGWQCHPQLFHALDEQVMRRAIQAQFQLLTQVNHLQTFYEPMSSCQEVATQTLASARWIQRLPLLAEGILEIIYEYQRTCIPTKTVIEKTKLYQQIILPILSGENLGTLPERQLNHLFELLKDYAQTMKEVNPLHQRKISATLLNFQHHIAAIEHFSSPQLTQLFRPDSYFARVRNGKICPLNEIETNLLATAGEQHNNWLNTQLFSPEKTFENLLIATTKKSAVLQDIEFRYWLLNNGLFSTLTKSLNVQLMQELLGHYPVDELLTQIEKIHLRLTHFSNAYKVLRKLSSTDSIQMLIQELLTYSTESLQLQLAACEFAQQPHWSNLLLFILQTKKTNLPWSQLKYLLLPMDFTNHFEIDWIRQEFQVLTNIESKLTCRGNQLAQLGFSYYSDDQNATRLTALSQSFLKKENNIDVLATVLNSYLPLFSTPENSLICTHFLQTLTRMFFDPEKTYALFGKLSDSLLTQIIIFALKTPKQHEELLQQIIQAGLGVKCQPILKQHLKFLLNECVESNRPLSKLAEESEVRGDAERRTGVYTSVHEDSSTASTKQFASSVEFGKRSNEDTPQSLQQLSPKQFVRLTPTNCHNALIVQRLLFHIQPLTELQNWQRHIKDENKQAGAFFCADAGLYTALIELKQQINSLSLGTELATNAEAKLANCFDFLRQEAKGLSYFKLMDEFLKGTNLQQPAVYYHWLCLSSFLTKEHSILLNNFLDWLEQIEESELSKQVFLDKLLKCILDNDQLIALCQRLPKIKTISELKSTWLFERIVHLKPVDTALIQNIVSAFSWPWLLEQIKTSSLNRLTLLQFALQHERHAQAILHDIPSKLTFLSLLDQCQLPANDLIRLQRSISNKSICSLISCHLLSRPDYIERINGQSFLAQITDTQTQFSCRLQPLVRQLEVANLPLKAIEQMQPEAAASLFCSLKHFHQFDEMQIQAFLQLTGSQRDILINYWLNHYASLPNASNVLIILINKFPQQVFANLTQMDKKQRQPLLSILIKHLDKLTKFNAKNINELCYESHLVYASQLYLHGGQLDKALIEFINNLIEKLLEKSVSLTSQTIQLLIKLSEKEECSLLRIKLGKATGDYLRSSAMFADCSIFYDDGRINIKRMQKTISLKTEQSSREAQHGFLHVLTSAWKKKLPADENPIIKLNELPANPLIGVLATHVDSIKSFDYFLIHYHGNQESMQRCIDNYLSYFEFSDYSPERLKQLQTTAWLMNRAEVSPATRKTLFDCLLNHPKLFNEAICANLLRFDGSKAISHFGMNRDYQTLISLCSLALPSLENDTEILTITQRALSEARFELSLAQISGFLSNLRIWLKRSFFYGWDGWFQPKQPQYVTAFYAEQESSEQLSTKVVLEGLQLSSRHSENLAGLIFQINCHADLPSLTAVHDALVRYEWQVHHGNELQTREKVDHLFEGLFQRAKFDRSIDNWLTKHLEPFIANRAALIGLYCQTGQDKLKPLLQCAVQGPGNFHAVATELTELSEPELLIENTTTLTQQSKESVLGGITEKISSFSEFFWATTNIIPSKVQNLSKSSIIQGGGGLIDTLLTRLVPHKE